MKKVLVLSFFPAFLPPRSGGELRLFHVYRELGRFCQVLLLSSSHVDIAEERVVHADRFVERRIPKDHHFVGEWQRLGPHAGAGDLSAVCVAGSARFATPLHQAFLEEYADADLIVHDSPFTVDYDLFIGLDAKPRIYNSYNCESALFRQLHPGEGSALLHDIVDRCERKLLHHADLVTYCADSDLLAFEQLLGGPMRRALLLPNGCVPQAPRAARAERPGQRLRAIFIGSAHLPNAEAARFIATELAPALPDLDFDIAGGCLPEAAYAANVVRHGPVDADTKARLLADADLALNPMSSGSGSNLKVLEFFGHGLPVLSTSFGVRGYEVRPGVDCVVAALPGFAAALRALVDDPVRMQAIGRSGKQTIDGRYAWSAIARRLLGTLGELQAPAGRPLAQPFVLGLNDYDPVAATGGGAIRIQGLYRAVERHMPVMYLCFSGNGEWGVAADTPGFTLIKVPKTADHLRAEAQANARHWVAVTDIVAIGQAAENPFLAALYRVLRRDAAIIVLDHPYMVKLPAAHGDSAVYSSQNDETRLKGEILQGHPDRAALLAAVETAETEAVSCASTVVAVSEEDAESLMRGRPAGSSPIVVRNGAHEPARARAADLDVAAARVGPNAVVFVGSPHLPNVESARFVAERLAAACPAFEFHILGGVCAALAAPLLPNVHAWGQVTDSLKTAVLERCTVAVNPMFGGGGSNVKLADFLGHGLHVVVTPFGCRGYPADISPHVTVAVADGFVDALRAVVADRGLNEPARRALRKALFSRSLSMTTVAGGFANALVDLCRPKRKVLFVTYRWVWPIRGGAESHLLEYLRALGRDGRFHIDVVSTDVEHIADEHRFACAYTPSIAATSPAQIPNLHYRRFPVDGQTPQQMLQSARRLWHLQPAYEHALYMGAPRQALPTGLAWGWGGVEGSADAPRRWAFSCAGLHLARAANVVVRARALQPGAVLVLDHAQRFLAHVELADVFTIAFDAEAGTVSFEASAPCRIADDARPLAFYVEVIEIDAEAFDLARPTLVEHTETDAATDFWRRHRAAMAVRAPAQADLAASRGPHSPALDAFIDRHIANYDLVITHNPVFRPAQVAVAAARAAGVPAVVVPHAHLDDDFYHFPDVLRAVVNASVVLAAPQAACDFFRRRGAPRVEYLPPGFDTSEPFTDDDERAFRGLWPDDRPFVLVLGRKSPTKGYSDVIAAVERLAAARPIAVLLIGPDDDGQAVTSAAARYLGPQPRNVVRGALRSCVALVNMSHSESFGMVLLECWLAGRPVVANRRCAAFADLVEHEHNGLFASDLPSLASALTSLLDSPEQADRLGRAGRETALRYGSDVIGRRLVEVCFELCNTDDTTEPVAA